MGYLGLMKLRADELLVKKGLVASRNLAKSIILAGQVFSPSGVRIEKAGHLLPEESILEIRERMPFVGRGGLKLDHALDEFEISVTGLVCLDVGASTGGFTDCLLQRGASKVYAVDVGYGQFHWKLRNDPRIVLLERANFRYLSLEKIPEPIHFAVVDVSFISLTKILPKLISFLKPRGEAVVLVKPQFELSPQEVKKGVVRSEPLRNKAIQRVSERAIQEGFERLGDTPSPIRGPKGNQEHLLHLRRIMIVLALFLTQCATNHPPVKTAVLDKKDPAYHYLLSEVELGQNHPQEALALLDRAIAEEPNEPYLRYKRAILQASLGDLQKAEQEVQRALGFDPRHLDSYILLGRILASRGEKVGAVSNYQKALTIDPKSEEANLLLIEATLGEKKYSELLRQVQAWQQADSETTTPLFYEAWVEENFLKSPKRAIDTYEKILALEPSNLKALTSLADLYLGQKKEAKAIELFQRMELLAPNNLSLKLKIALLYYEHKEFDRAIEKFQELKVMRPHEDRIIYYLGIIDENSDRPQEAEQEYRQIKPSSLFFKDARLHLAYLQVKGGKRGEAIRLLEEAIRFKPAAAPFYEYLAEIYRDDGQNDQAIKTLRKGLKKSPEKEGIYYTLGMIYDRAGHFEEGMASMREVLKINPQNANAMNYLGYSYADRGIRLEEALDLTQKALALKPGDGYITDSLGWVYYQRGDLEKALFHIQKAYQTVPREPTVTEHLGDIYLKKHETRKALRYFREALSILQQKKEDPQETEKDRRKIEEKIQALVK